MKKQRWTCAVVVASLAVVLPATALATTFDDNPNSICLAATQAGVNYMCTGGGQGVPLNDFTLNMLGGADTVQVSNATCSCTCTNAANAFVYGVNTLVVNGGDGDDLIHSVSSGRNDFRGDAGGDSIKSGSHNGDTLSGGTGPDWIVDTAGTSETIYGGPDADQIRDIGCTYTSIDCGASMLDKCACGGPSIWCGSATCEFGAGPIDIACPGL